MKFDVIVGNPPYQLQGASGGNNDAPIFQEFSVIANTLAQKCATIIEPSRWFAAGRENLLGEYRANMLTCGHVKRLVTYVNGADVFQNVEIKGGISYYLFVKSHEGLCEYSLIKDGNEEKVMRDLSEFDILIREPKLASIVHKITELNNNINGRYVDTIISNDTPFGIPSNPRTSTKNPFAVYTKSSQVHDILLYHIENQKRKVEYAALKDIRKNTQDIDTPKVFIPGAGGAGNDPYVLGKPEVAPKHSVCSQSYLYAAFRTDDEANNFCKYAKTKFLRILVSAMKITQSAPQRVYRFVPMQDYTMQSDIEWNKSIEEIDKQLYQKYMLSDEEIAYINTTLKAI